MAEKGESEKPKNAVDISTLSLQELEEVKKGIEQDLQYLSQSRASLVTAAQGYQTSKDTLGTVTKENEGREVLVPITSSMYVPATVSDTEKVLVEYGANYFVEQKVPDAQAYFGRRVDMVKEQIQQFADAMESKRHIHEQVIMVMQQKIAAISSQQGGSGELQGLKVDG